MRVDDSFFDQCDLILFECIHIDREADLFLCRIIFFERDRETRQICLLQFIVYVVDHLLEKRSIRSGIFFVNKIIISIEIADHIAVIVNLIRIEIAIVEIDKNILFPSISESLHLFLNQCCRRLERICKTRNKSIQVTEHFDCTAKFYDLQ